MDLNTLPRYQCHKIVRAAKIVGTTTTGGSNHLGMHLALKDVPDFAPFVTTQWVGQHVKGPDVEGGYLVMYDDGYTSWSPAKAFEEGYTLLDRLGDYEGAKIKQEGS